MTRENDHGKMNRHTRGFLCRARARHTPTMGALARAILATLSILARVAPRLDASRLPPVSIRASPAFGSVRTTVIDGCRTRCREATFEPVCVDGTRTYSNECWARCAVEGGLVATGDDDDDDPLASASLVRGACARDREAFATAGFACARACVAVYEPVCAENGQSVSNACIADCSRLRYVEGSCAV